MEQEDEDTEFSAVNWFFLASGLCCNITHNVFRMLEKLTGVGKEELILPPVNANNRAVCLRGRRDARRKELVVMGASGGRAPGAHTSHETSPP